MTDLETAQGLKPFVFTGRMRRRLMNRHLMRQKRLDPTYREQENARQRAYAREMRVAWMMMKSGKRFEDDPEAD